MTGCRVGKVRRKRGKKITGLQSCGDKSQEKEGKELLVTESKGKKGRI